MGILDVKNMVCEKCSHRGRGNWDDQFCSKCGGTLKKFESLPYVGEDPTKGIYRITIVVEQEFRNSGHAQETAEKSELGEDEGYFRDCDGVGGEKPIKWEFIRSTVTAETHPYECKTCKTGTNEYLQANPPVAKTIEGRCDYCDQQDWVERINERNGKENG